VNRSPGDVAVAVPHILMVEDHALIRQFMEMALVGAGFRVTVAENGDQARALLEGGAVADLLLSDIRMPGSMDGIQLASWVRVNRPRMAVLLQTGFSHADLADFTVLQKPISPEELLDAVRRELRQPRGVSGMPSL
jgi:DNA-binding NtrC family response regulator